MNLQEELLLLKTQGHVFLGFSVKELLVSDP